MGNNYFGGSRGESFSEVPKASVSESTNSSISESKEIHSENNWNDVNKYLGNSTANEVNDSNSSDSDKWNDIDKYISNGSKEEKESSTGEYVVEVTYLAGSDVNEQEIHDKMESAYSKTTSSKNMREFKEKIEEISDDIKVVDARVVSSPEFSDSQEKIEKSVYSPEENIDVHLDKPAAVNKTTTDAPEQKAELPNRFDKAYETDTNIPEAPFEVQDDGETLESIKKEKTEMSGEKAYMHPFETIDSAKDLNERFETEFYKQGKHNKNEMNRIQVENTSLMNDIEVQKSLLDKAIKSKYDEIYDYVTEGKMTSAATQRDPHYISMIEEYKDYQALQNKLNYYSASLTENNSRILEITGKSGDKALAQAENVNGKMGIFERISNNKLPSIEKPYEAEQQLVLGETDNTEETFDPDDDENTDVAYEISEDTEATVGGENYEYHMLKDTDEKIGISDHNSKQLEWKGEIGNSIRVPKDSESELVAELNKYGVEGIEYNHGNIDFSPVALYEVEFSNQDELYRNIGKGILIKQLETRQDFNNAIRDKWQSLAKKQVVERINENEAFASEFRDRTGIDVSKVTSESALKSELKRVGLTMHETTDCSRIQFVPTKIHDAYKHSGGTSEMLERQLSADIRGWIESVYTTGKQ